MAYHSTTGTADNSADFTDVAYFVVPPNSVDLRFAFYLLKSLRLTELGKGIKPGLSRKVAYSLSVCIPPLAEQKRIVAKVDELMALCDRLEAQQQERDTLHAALARASLARFADAPTRTSLNFLFQKSYDIAPVDLRKSILTLSIQGKLVPQAPGDETATSLLKRVETRKMEILSTGYPNESEAKVQIRKHGQQTLPDDLPELPESWGWSTLLSASLLVVDCHNKTAPYTKDGIRLLRTTNIRNGELNFNEPKYVSNETYERWSARCKPESGDLLITREAPMGETCIIPDGLTICMGQRMMLVRLLSEQMENRYVIFAIMAPGLMERVQDKPVGATVQHLRVGGVETMLIPIPPLAEQRRIVAKVDQLMALVDELETQLSASRSTARNLLDALVFEITATGTPISKGTSTR